MRLILTAALLIMPAAVSGANAHASSIAEIGGTVGSSENSIVTHHCGDCSQRPKAGVAPSTYRVPALVPGTQKMEIVEINGEKRLVRTEAWSGGSPVVFVSKVPSWLKDGSSVADIHPAEDGSTEADIVRTRPSTDGIDASATTSAVEPAADLPKPIEQASNAPQPLSTDGFELRLDQLR